MNKLMTVVAASVCAVSLSSSRPAFAGETPENKPSEVAETEEESPAVFEAGFDFDFFSAYVWRNAVQTDGMVMQPCVWADLTYFEPFWVGFSIWQNYDLSDRRRNVYRYGLNETDYNVHAGVTAWSSEDGEWELGFELGHEWYTYHGVRDSAGEDWLRGGYPDTREVYVKATFDNPVVNVYGQASWMYGDFGDYRAAMHYELGFNKEVEIVDSVTVGADWNVNFGDGRYLDFLYGSVKSGAYDHAEEGDDPDVYDDYANQTSGIGGTTLKLYLTWQLTDCLSLGGTIAYTGLLNGALRESLGDQGDENDFCYDGTNYARDLLWGGVSLKLTF